MMIEKTNEIIKEMEVMIEQFKNMIDIDDVMKLDNDQIQAYKSMFNMIDLSKDLMLEQATMIDQMDHKLNNIHERLGILSEQIELLIQQK